MAVGGTLALAAAARLAGADLDGAAVWVYEVAVALTAPASPPISVGPRTRAAVTGLVVDLGDRYEPQALRAALAHTVGDPDLEVVYRVAVRRLGRRGRAMPFGCLSGKAAAAGHASARRG